MSQVITAHSIRIGPTVIDAFMMKASDISGVVVIKHTDTGKDHCHVYFPHKPIAETRNQLDLLKVQIKSELNLKDVIKTNRDWSWSNANTSLKQFWDYAMYEKGTQRVYKRPGASVLLWNNTESMPEIPPDRPSSIIVRPVSTKVSTFVKRQRFYNYCKEYFQENPEIELNEKEIGKLLFHYWKAGAEDGSERIVYAKEYINQALYKLIKDSGDTVAMDLFQERWVAKALR